MTMSQKYYVPLLASIAFIGGVSPRARAQCANDFDCDDIPDWVEDQLLTTLAPVLYSPEPSYSSMQTIDWFVRHSILEWWTGPDEQYVGESSPFIAIDDVMNIIDMHAAQGHNYHYLFRFRERRFRHADDPSDPIDWDIHMNNGTGYYGRVARRIGGEELPNGYYAVQYFIYFGWNETDTPPGCDLGNHDGDWLCLDLDVEASDPINPRIVRAVMHNHGRQIFVESSAGLRFEEGHPVIFPERGVQELWPFPSPDGFGGYPEPPLVSTNERLFGDILGNCVLEYETGCNFGYTAVRQHEGVGVRFQITTVQNVGEEDHPYPSEEAVFFQRFDGWWGKTHVDGGCYGFGSEHIEPPKSPRFNSKMWERNYNAQARDWASWANQNVTHVDFSYGGEETGAAEQPFNHIDEALGVVARGGEIRLRAGTSPERLLIVEPCTIMTEEGVATIGE